MLTDEERTDLLKYLHAIADAPATDNNENPFKLAINALKSSQIWQCKPSIHNYIQQWWMSCPEHWPCAFREKELEMNINTNNSAESLNKLLTYKFLKRYAEKSLCTMISLLLETLLPHLYREYLSALVRARSTDRIRVYGSYIPPFLKGHPCKFIEHCLPRIQYADTELNGDRHLLNIDLQNKAFQVKSSNGPNVYSCDLKIPRCDCMD